MNRVLITTALTIMLVACKKDDEVVPPPEKPKKWIVSTIAGNGQEGFINGPALSAAFHFPEDVVVLDNGDIFATDVLNFCIRKISGGQVTTFAGGTGFDIVNGNGTKAQFKNQIGRASCRERG